MTRSMVGRIRGREAGYTLVELLVAIAVMGFVTAATVQIQLITADTVTIASAALEAQDEGRGGLDRILSELEQIGAFYTGATNAGTAITAASSTSITFLGDVDGDTLDAAGAEARLILAVTAGATTLIVDRAGGFVAGEVVFLASGAAREVRTVALASGSTITLSAALTNAFPLDAMVRSVESVNYTLTGTNVTRALNGGAAETVVSNVTGMAFTYFDANGNQLIGAIPPASVREVRVSLTNTASNGKLGRAMLGRVRPRSLAL